LRLLILLAREGFLKDKCGPRAKKFEHHCSKASQKKKSSATVEKLMFFLQTSRSTWE